MFEIGRVCVKIAGRDAGSKCVVIDVLDLNFVMVDGQTRRRKCNLRHLEPLETIVKVRKNASNAEVVTALKEAGIECSEKKPIEKKDTKKRPTRIKKVKVKAAAKEEKPKKAAKPAKAPEKKSEEPAENKEEKAAVKHEKKAEPKPNKDKKENQE